jgi:hypothetical protein
MATNNTLADMDTNADDEPSQSRQAALRSRNFGVETIFSFSNVVFLFVPASVRPRGHS